MTSLIDVIFLLLLFFMLSSTFTRFSEVQLSAAGTGGAPGELRPVFLQLAADRLTLNGTSVPLENLPARLAERTEGTGDDPLPLLVALKGEVTAQRLTDLLVVLGGVEGVQATVLGGS
ncbi:Biopolymer transport protein ExbD/TolR [Salipiger mucosus DSM 16094]|uniref:Biopolymer transport protein ExbD/TolR n=2 Tax=Salipiger mucosus TaxID=263378 RepID=S9RBE3_9RHOB|nr:Biopolymer transport protein ExbD/TolR [Salipiger mucosus DSM 16094]